jgi:hypothetical protein
LNSFLVQISNGITITLSGAPAMVGRQQGLNARLKEKKLLLICCHCVIHQSVQFAKLSDNFQALLTTVTKMINYTEFIPWLKLNLKPIFRVCLYCESLLNMIKVKVVLPADPNGSLADTIEIP